MKTILLMLALSITAAAQPKLVKYYMGFLKKGPNWTAQATAETAEIQKGHMAHLKKMHEMKKLVVAGPLGDNTEIRGILIFRGNDSMEDLQQLAAQDPAVKAGRLIVELHPWFVEENVLP